MFFDAVVSKAGKTVLTWFIGVIGVITILGGLYVFKLRGDISTLESDLNAATALAESRGASIVKLQNQALKSTKIDIKHSTARAGITTKLRKSVQAVRKEAEHEGSTRITDVELSRLRELVAEANSGIRASSTTSE